MFDNSSLVLAEDVDIRSVLPPEPKKDKKRPRQRPVSKVPAIVIRNIQPSLRKYIAVLEMAHKKDVNESDTSNIVNDILGDVLGFDKFFDVTTEYKIRGQYADYGIRIKDKIHAFIEVKAINIALNQNHLFQVASYAVHEGVDWAILTNGNVWQLYRIQDSKPIQNVLVTSVDLLDPNLKYSAKVNAFAPFHKRCLVGGCVEGLWREKSCVNSAALKGIITSKKGLDFLKRELRRASGYSVETKRIEEMLHKEILK
ncbi:MAG: type I restriction enzyme HsdR N-terminal domain-containing protein [Patescibacteria group bacterium]|jgi:predicted type IV restriction endonuclease